MTKFLTLQFLQQKNKAGDRVNVITMEDWKNGENDYNDVAFVISSNPIAAIEVPDVPNPGDRQGTEKYSGVLGFEDNWYLNKEIMT